MSRTQTNHHFLGRALAWLILPLALSLCALIKPAVAHEVIHDVALVQAMSVKLAYSDGEAFSYESYELYADGSKTPTQTGRTDAQGRVTFIPGTVKTWRLRAFSADGHGVDLKFPSIATDANSDVTVSQAAPSRSSRILFGISVILAAFGILQFFIRRKKSS